ncbi:MAG: AAA family ATPase, partial [Bifidobacteriaceae bacterium]|nr:AAA family ATPase [Bifidobacteriaceae bacterium]
MSDLVPRHLLERGRQLLDASPCLIVEGARQVGKSTFVTMLVAGRPATVVTLDDSQTRHLAAADPDAFVDQAREATLVIDEIQRSPELILPIKASIDRDRRPGRFVLTGSADLLRLQRTPDSLAGRALTIQLRGFSQGEIRRRPDDFITWLIHAYHDGFNPWAIRSDLTRSDYVDVLAVGSYPQLVLGDPTVRRSWVNSYLRQIIQRDSADV